jgi:hypothetical protein
MDQQQLAFENEELMKALEALRKQLEIKVGKSHALIIHVLLL